MIKYHAAAKYEIRQTIKPRIAPLTAAVGGALAAGSLQAATITVDSLDGGRNGGECTLRSALYSSTLNSSVDACNTGEAGQDTIVFESSLSGTVDLSDSDSALYFDGSTLPVGESVSIDGNNAITVQGTFGGPVFYSKYNDNYANDKLEISGLTITWGEADYGGGILSYGRRLELEDVTIEDNEAGIAGAGIWHEPQTGAGFLLIQDSVISGNQVLNQVDGKAAGVGVSMQLGGTVSIFGTSFEGNQTPSDANGGGALSLDMDVAYVDIYESSFTNNLTLGNGGGVWADLSYAVVNVFGNTFTGNNAADGGGLYLREQQGGVDQKANITLENNTFDNNSAQRGGGAAIVIANGDGGTNDDPVKFVDIIGDNEFTDNSAVEGGALYLDLNDTVPATITGATFADNQADYFGGGALIRADSSDVSVSYSSFNGNNSEFGGGGLRAEINASEITLLNSDLINNSDASGAGGGIEARLTDGAFSARGLFAVSNSAGAGGAVQVDADASDFGMDYSTFYSNTASGCGGGVRVTGTPNEVGIGHSIFAGNSGSCGGAVDLFAPSAGNVLVELKYNEMSSNTATSTGTTGGGAIFADLGSGSTAFIKNSTISGNSSDGLGGGIRLRGDMSGEIKYTTVAENYAYDTGGGIYSSVSSCSIDNTILAGNTNQSGAYQDLSGPYDCEVSNSLIAGAKYSDYSDGGGNIVNVAPDLEPLADNGGNAGWTHALQPGSPAIDAGDEGSSVPDYDQRGAGFPRMVGAALDMGAYEVASPQEDGIFSDRFEQP